MSARNVFRLFLVFEGIWEKLCGEKSMNKTKGKVIIKVDGKEYIYKNLD